MKKTWGPPRYKHGVGMGPARMVRVLNADDLYQPDRFAVMTRKWAARGWLFREWSV
jgi:hypothetical protein